MWEGGRRGLRSVFPTWVINLAVTRLAAPAEPTLATYGLAKRYFTHRTHSCLSKRPLLLRSIHQMWHMKADSAHRLRGCARGRVESCWAAVFSSADQTGIRAAEARLTDTQPGAGGVYMTQRAACAALLMLQCQYADSSISRTCCKCKTTRYTVQPIRTGRVFITLPLVRDSQQGSKLRN